MGLRRVQKQRGNAMNIYSIFRHPPCSEYGEMTVWCARDVAHLTEMMLEYTKSERQFADRKQRQIQCDAVREDCKKAVLLTAEKPGLLADFST